MMGGKGGVQSWILNSPAIALTSRSGWVAANVPAGMCDSAFVSPPWMSELSSPMIGTICVSLLKGPAAAAPK
jgi:hypothetical protein